MRKRQQPSGWTAVVLLLLALSCACGSEDGAEMDEQEVSPLSFSNEDFAIVTPIASGRSGVPAEVAAVRILPSGAMHVEVEGGPCAALSRFNVLETPTTVQVEARIINTAGDGACTANIIPWLVELRLDEELGGRTVIDQGTGEDVPVYHCADHPELAFCSPDLIGRPAN